MLLMGCYLTCNETRSFHQVLLSDDLIKKHIDLVKVFKQKFRLYSNPAVQQVRLQGEIETRFPMLKIYTVCGIIFTNIFS